MRAIMFIDMSDTKFYNITNDVLFKLIFGVEKHRRILVCLLNALLQLEGPSAISSVEILNPYNERKYPGDKLSILDVKARDERGLLYNVEMQVSVPDIWSQRVLYYASCLYTSQMEKGTGYQRLCRTISISLLDEILFPEYEELHNTYRFRNDLTSDELAGDLIELHFIELAKFDKDKPRSLSTRFEKWLHTLRFAELYREGTMSLPKELLEEEGIREALEAMCTANADPEVREMMLSREIFLRDMLTGRICAREEGRKEGREEGRKEGREEGQKEEKLTIARKMKEKGHSNEMIVDITGLSLEEVEAL